MAEQFKIKPATGKWTIRAGGAVLGETKSALEVTDANKSAVIYFPVADVAMAFLDGSSTVTSCPYRGEAKHYSIQTKSTLIEDAGYIYDAPTEDLMQLKDHIAFYSDKATVART